MFGILLTNATMSSLTTISCMFHLSTISIIEAPTSRELLEEQETFTPAVAVQEQICMDEKCIADLVPFSHVFSARRNHKKILSFFSPAQEEEVWGRHGGNPQIKPKIITSNNKFMGGINS
jgi:hypothetical protein